MTNYFADLKTTCSYVQTEVEEASKMEDDLIADVEQAKKTQVKRSAEYEQYNFELGEVRKAAMAAMVARTASNR